MVSAVGLATLGEIAAVSEAAPLGEPGPPAPGVLQNIIVTHTHTNTHAPHVHALPFCPLTHSHSLPHCHPLGHPVLSFV